MSDPVVSMLSAVARPAGRMLWRAAVWVARDEAGKRAIKRAAGTAATSVTNASIEGLRERGVKVSPTVEQVATGAVTIAVGFAGAKTLDAIAQVPGAEPTPAADTPTPSSAPTYLQPPSYDPPGPPSPPAAA